MEALKFRNLVKSRLIVQLDDLMTIIKADSSGKMLTIDIRYLHR